MNEHKKLNRLFASCAGIIALLLSGSACGAFDPNDICVERRCDTVECVRGKCAGWRVVSASWDGITNHVFQCFNETGEPAFRVTCRVNLYDSFGHNRGMLQQKAEGPINKYLRFLGSVSTEVSKMDAEIYYATEPFDFGKDGQTREDGGGFTSRAE